MTISCIQCGDSVTASRASRTYCDGCNAERKRKYNSEYARTAGARVLRAISHRSTRQRAYDGYEGKCTCCGVSDFEFLCLDHVNGGGGKDRKVRNTWQIAKYVIQNNFPAEVTVLCHNCNLAKGFFVTCHHQGKRVA